MKRTDVRHGAFTLDGILTQKECSALIHRAEALGFELAPITTAEGFVIDTETRNNQRVMFDDVSLAVDLWSKVKAGVPQSLSGRHAIGLNERFRIYRYTPGQRFSWHSDGAYVRATGEGSLFTFMIYLNEGYRGGSTLFEGAEVAGRAGMALVFRHSLFHEGAVVVAGKKYVLRSDVMYGPRAGAPTA